MSKYKKIRKKSRSKSRNSYSRSKSRSRRLKYKNSKKQRSLSRLTKRQSRVSKMSRSTRSSTRKKTKKNKQIKKYIIKCCEPCSNVDDPGIKTIDIIIPQNFYSELAKPKIVYKNKGKAFIFGDKFKLSEYVYVGSHENKSAQTGFVDMSGITKSEISRILDFRNWIFVYNIDAKLTREELLNLESNEFWDFITKKEYKKIDWDSRSRLNKLQETLPRVLFVGKTTETNSGANIYVHYNRRGLIDGIIVDIFCFFPKVTRLTRVPPGKKPKRSGLIQGFET